MRKWILALFADSTGTPSAIRLAAFLVLANVMLVWTYKSFLTPGWIPLGADAVGLIIGVLGAKAFQRRHENGRKE